MPWYKKVLIKRKNEIISSAIFAIIFALALLLWSFGLGKSFVWKKVEPISVPNLFDRAFYSALVYVTVGAVLYRLKLWLYLYILAVRKLRDRKLYRETKKFIWLLLIFGMYGIFSKIVDLLNSIISFAYNILGFILYVLPPLGISLIIVIPLFIFTKKYKYLK
jgi:hypothetical protein